MITLTELAKQKIKEISEAEGIGHYCVRVKVLGSGCAGLAHDMIYDDQISDTDEVVEFDDIKIVVDQMSSMYMDEVEIDYIDREISSGFRFNAPNKRSCGCGNSFEP
jgi:iron-sulfur cluster assembly accessory protein